MMTLAARVAALERTAPPAVTGYQISRVDPGGAILETKVLIIGQTENGRTRTISVADFETVYPDGQIRGGVILTDDGTAPAPDSLYAQWFPREADA
jgi:hypothetical protein